MKKNGIIKNEDRSKGKIYLEDYFTPNKSPNPVLTMGYTSVQASIHEGFGYSVAEAMLCECVPVTSRKAALPEVVGNCGLYVDDLNPQSVANKIKEALASDLGQEARARIMQEFPLEKRREALLAEVGKVMSR